jgi:cell wall-associated NlpC family hydrolase
MWKRLKVDGKLLLDIAKNMEANHCGYKLGAKAPTLGCDSHDIKRIDCSGFVRYIIYRITSGMVKLPDGSWRQHEWCSDQGFKLVRYNEVAFLHDGRLRIAFKNADGGVGHTWLILNGETIEAYGGQGVGRRPWDTLKLKKLVDACYVLTDVV